jgi:hypothetical protein
MLSVKLISLTLANKILDFKVLFLLVDLTKNKLQLRLLVSTQIKVYLSEYDQTTINGDFLVQLPVHQTNFPPPATGTLSPVFGISEMSQN